mmetsp:Transcript_10187/g.35446  ORF Transcript_10187/g.35446 Transcript_10187/m.35446 type:complete len:86 (+) Transcript_10187:663-920(+)
MEEPARTERTLPHRFALWDERETPDRSACASSGPSASSRLELHADLVLATRVEACVVAVGLAVHLGEMSEGDGQMWRRAWRWAPR